MGILHKLIPSANPYGTYAQWVSREEEAYLSKHKPHSLQALAVIITGDDITEVQKSLNSIPSQNRPKVYCTADLSLSAVTVLTTEKDLLSQVSETYIMTIDAGDELSKHAIAVLSDALSEHPGAAVLYYDTDEKHNGIRSRPCYHPAWSPDYFNSAGYVRSALINRTYIPNTIPQTAASFTPLAIAKGIFGGESILHLPHILLTVAQKEDAGHPVELTVREDTRGQIELLPNEHGNALQLQYKLNDAPLISIIIPTRNKSGLVKQCIDSILHRSLYTNYEIILVDNRSDEPALDKLISTYKQLLGARLIHVKADMEFNFSSLINLGAAHSKGPLLLLLNNDVEVITPGWLELMAGYAMQPHIGCAGVKLLYPNNCIQHAGIILQENNISSHIHLGKERYEHTYQDSLNTTRNYAAITAACMMVSKEKFERAGRFEELFKVEYNDIDFCLRLLDQGLYNVYLPFVELYHHESASRRHPHSDRVSFDQHNKERELMRQRWKKYIDNDPFNNTNRPFVC